jgi:hypothetical protein
VIVSATGVLTAVSARPQVADNRPSGQEINELLSLVKNFCKNGKRCQNHHQHNRCKYVHPETILRDPTLSPWVKDNGWSLAMTHPAQLEQSVQMGAKPSPQDEIWHHRLPDQVRALATGGVGPAATGAHSAVPTAPALVSGGVIVAAPAPGPGGQAAAPSPSVGDLEKLQGLVSLFCRHSVHCSCRSALCGQLHPSELQDYPLSPWVRSKATELFDLYPFGELTQEEYKARMGTGTVEVKEAAWLIKIRLRVKEMQKALALLL